MKYLFINILIFVTLASGAHPWIESVSPVPNSVSTPANFTVTVQFNRSMDEDSFENNIFAHSSLRGFTEIKDLQYNPDEYLLSFELYSTFTSGENIEICLTGQISDSVSQQMETACSWSFQIAATAGSGYFGLKKSVSFSESPTDFQIADFNNDGEPDAVVVLSQSAQVLYLKNNGDLNFNIIDLPYEEVKPAQVLAADFNRDGLMDCAVISGGDFRQIPKLTIYKNENGTVLNPVQTILLPQRPLRALDGDFNLDGWPDIFSAHLEQGINVYENAGEQGFSLQQSVPMPQISDIAFTALKTDGSKNLAVAGQSENKLNIFELILETYQNRKTISIAAPAYLATADFDQDSLNDIIVGGQQNSGMLKNYGNYLFFETTRFEEAGRSVYPDLNADYLPDAVFNTGKIYLNSDANEFEARSEIVSARKIIPADLDMDGSIDLVSAPLNSTMLHFYRNGSSSLPFSLLSPADEDSIDLAEGTPVFNWRSSPDPFDRDVTYRLRVFNLIQDTLIVNLQDTVFSFAQNGFLKSGHFYQWNVIADNGEVDLPARKSHRFFTKDQNTIGIFELLYPLHNDTVSSLNFPVRFRWQNPQNSSKRKMSFKLYIQSSTIDTAFANITDTAFTISPFLTFLPFSQINWFVEAYDGIYRRESAAGASFVVGDYNLIRPFELVSPLDNSALAMPDSSIDFRWQTARDVRGFFVFYDLEITYGQQKALYENIYDNEYSAKLPAELTTSGDFLWRVIARSMDGYSRSSYYRTFRINQPQQFIIYGVYPNPFNDQTRLKLNLPADTELKIELFNVLGQKSGLLLDRFEKAGIKNIYLQPGADLSSGVYYLKIETETATKYQKLMLIR